MTRDILEDKIIKIVKDKYGTTPSGNVVSISKNFGDYSTSVALTLENPKEKAQGILEELNSDSDLKKHISKIEIAGPGFINFTLTENAVFNDLKEIERNIKTGFDFLNKEKVNVEFISANPTGELHIGHGRGAFYGDALSSVLEFSGANVTREYYINDSKESNQIKEVGKTALGEGETYLTDILKEQIKKLKTDSKDYGEVGFELSKIVQEDNKEFIEKILGIRFDEWYSEDKELRATLLNDRILAALKMKDLTYEKEGAVWLKTSEYGDDEDRVLVRSDGGKSYFISDISYHSNKFDRGYSRVVNVWGADHHGHVKRMMAVKNMLDWKGDFKIFITQLVSLKEGKMSKRAGNVILLRDLVKDIGIDVVRWFFNEKAITTHMEFDMERAREQSENNPVFYVQYAHARMNSIIDKAKGYKSDESKLENVLAEKSAKSLAMKILQFRDVVEVVSSDYQVNRLTTYVYELANAFSQFYRDVRVVGEDSYNNGALELVLETKNTIAKTLSLLGISAPAKM